jgi:imidazolonepropionase-like amidohydrolase
VAHAIATQGIAHAYAAGADSIDHVGWLSPDGVVRPDSRLIAELGASRWLCGLTASGIVRRELSGGAEGVAALRDRLADKAALAQAGARLHVHSDAGVRFTPIDRPDLGLRVAVEGGALQALAAIAAMTSVAAEAVGLGGEVGVIRVGARADLLMVDGDPLVDPAALHAVRGVWMGGRRVIDRSPGGQTVRAVA